MIKFARIFLRGNICFFTGKHGLFGDFYSYENDGFERRNVRCGLFSARSGYGGE